MKTGNMWHISRRWRDINWNWRNFGRQEQVALAAIAVGLIATTLGIASAWSSGRFWHIWNVWEFLAFGLGSNLAGHAFIFFTDANRRRQGIVYQHESRPPRPISIGALQAILGGGFVALAMLLGLFIWIAG